MGLVSLLRFSCDVFLKIRPSHIWLCRPEIHIKQWNTLKKDLKEGNNRTEWIDREPYAYWKGNINLGLARHELSKCNKTSEQDWNARIYDIVTNLHDSPNIFSNRSNT